MITYLILGIVAAALVLGVLPYNRLVRLRERYRNAFAQIDVQLKRRYDLIPNLVEVAKGYLQHERETLDAVIRARNNAQAAAGKAASNPGNPAAMQGLGGAELVLGQQLGRFFGLVESYPSLKGSENMLQLQEELGSTENRIAFARQAYNDAVMRYSAARGSVPTLFVANALGFFPAEFFEIDAPGERGAPRVSFT
ncbi:MAG: LemA family protein [Gemmatimonadetes bacterium]|nr:LemA family protein [Gemmatimonadota bacterium]